jgi:hypothetical protein
MSDKTRTRKTPGGIRTGRGCTATTGAAAKRSGLQGQSRSKVAEREAALLQGASEEVVAAADMSESQAPAEPTPFAVSDEPEVLPDQADGAPGNDTEAAAPDAAASSTHASVTSAGGSPIPSAAGQPTEEPAEADASSGEAAGGAAEVPKDAASGQAPSSASAETQTGSGPAPADEAAASLVPADAEGGSWAVGGQAPGRRTRAKKPAAAGDTAQVPAKTRRRTRADAASPQAAAAADQDAATGAEAKPARRRRKTDSETVSQPVSKQDRTSAPRKSPDRKGPGRKAGAASDRSGTRSGRSYPPRCGTCSGRPCDRPTLQPKERCLGAASPGGRPLPPKAGPIREMKAKTARRPLVGWAKATTPSISGGQGGCRRRPRRRPGGSRWPSSSPWRRGRASRGRHGVTSLAAFRAPSRARAA